MRRCGRGTPSVEGLGPACVGLGRRGEVLERAQMGEGGEDEVSGGPWVDGSHERGRTIRLGPMIAGVARVAPGPVEPLERLPTGIDHDRRIGAGRRVRR